MATKQESALKPEYVVITPARNEADHLQATIQSMAAQRLPPREWLIVDDGSTDGTGPMADAAAREHSWIKVLHRPDRGSRKAGGGVIEAFQDGLRQVQTSGWQFLSKFDADLTFDADFFGECLRRFDAEPRLGIAGGAICNESNGALVLEWNGDPPFHVRGATKIYRRACWEQIGGLFPAAGWDTLDELKALSLGWATRTFPDLKLLHHRPAGAADGAWKNWVKNGLANYTVGYHPLFMAVKCMKRAALRPYGLAALGLACGFLSGYWRRVPQVPDPAVIQYLRRQQLNRLLFRPSIWG
jgi:glycosyltransferase involved in cell wall biosynthesis